MLVSKNFSEHFDMWKASGWKQSISRKQFRKFVMNIAGRVPHTQVDFSEDGDMIHIWNHWDSIHIGWGKTCVLVSLPNGEEYYVNDLSGLNYVRRQILA